MTKHVKKVRKTVMVPATTIKNIEKKAKELKRSEHYLMVEALELAFKTA